MAKRSPIVGLMLDLQTFLLRRGWMGSLNNALMLITTTGRKSGRSFTRPIGFVRDGDDLLAFTVGGTSNWYRNMLARPEVTLEVQGRTLRARGRRIEDEAELARVVELYKQQRPTYFDRFFGVPATTPTPEAVRRLAGRILFVRFSPLPQNAAATKAEAADASA